MKSRIVPVLLLFIAVPAIGADYENISYAPALQAETELAPEGAGLTEEGDVEVELRNLAKLKVIAYRLGWTVTDCGSDRKRYIECALKEPFLHGTSGIFTRAIEPDSVARIRLERFNHLIVRQLEEKGGNRLNIYNVDLGVVYIRFADGTEWSYDLENKRRWKLDFNIGIPQTKLQPAQCTGACGYRAYAGDATSISPTTSAVRRTVLVRCA